MSRIAERIVENPAMSGGLIVMALTAAAVISNALFLQQSQHPEPWFATRPAPVALAPGSDHVVVPDPRPRRIPPAEPPMPRIQPAAAPPATEPLAPTAAPTLIADLQRALSERGFYAGKIDGISGSRTRAAITAYEKSQGLQVTGQPSASVLDHITTASVLPAEPPAAPDPAPAASPAQVQAANDETAGAPSTIETVVLESPAVERPAVPGEALSYPPRSEAVLPAPVAAPVAAAPAVDPGAQRTLSVQKALNLIGYGPVPEDGMPGEATIEAIRRFELDNGLPITGAAGDALINRLVAIGALEAA